MIRIWVPNNVQGERLADYAIDQKFRSVGILSVQNAFGSTITQAFKDRFQSRGGKIVADEEYSPTANTFRTELLRIKPAKPDALFFASYIKDGTILVREARQMGMSVPLLGPSTINSPDFLSATKNLADGLVFADLADSSTSAFRERWSTTFGAEFPGMQSGASLFYDVTTILGRWLQSGEPAKAADFLRSVDYSGAAGRISFTQDGSLDRVHSLFQISCGAVKPM